MSKLTVIPAKKQVGNTRSKEQNRLLRVCAYCRVSSNSDEQELSFGAQCEHYTNLINSNPEWVSAGIYADDGISGTNTAKRLEFNRMIEDAMAGKIDLIITKSISRFARNTLDTIKFVRQLRAQNIGVRFEKEGIFTLDPNCEVILTVLSALAQQESASLSQNVKMGLQYRYQQGKVQVNHKRFLGYTKDEEGHLVVEPSEAAVVRRIYREYLEGQSMATIARGLERDGILTGAGKKHWHTTTINKILRSEKYIGDALLQKTYTTDFLTKTRIKNDGRVPQYYVEGSHDAIIPKEVWLMVQEELVRRRVVRVPSTLGDPAVLEESAVLDNHTATSGASAPLGDSHTVDEGEGNCAGSSGRGAVRRYSASHCLSQIVRCQECGELFRRIHWNNRGCKRVVWRCINKVEKTGRDCSSRTVKEGDLQKAVLDAINKVLGDKESFMIQLGQNVEAAVGETVTEEKLNALQHQLIDLATRGEDYTDLAEEITRLKGKRRTSETSAVHIRELQEFLAGETGLLEDFDDKLIRRLIGGVTVLENGGFRVEFKSGVEVEVG